MVREYKADIVDVLPDATRGGFCIQLIRLSPALILQKTVYFLIFFGGGTDGTDDNCKLRTSVILLCSIFDLIALQALSGACGRKTESKVHFYFMISIGVFPIPCFQISFELVGNASSVQTHMQAHISQTHIVTSH